MRRLPLFHRASLASATAAIPILLLGLAACSSDSDNYTYRPSQASASPAVTNSALTNSGASGADEQPSVVIGTTPALMITPLTADGVNFIFQAGFAGVSEMHLGQLAQARAGSLAVRDFGSMILRDHTIANVALKSIGDADSVVLPAVPDSGRQSAEAILGGLQGPMFDRQFIQEQTTEHRMALALYGAEAQSSQDPDLRSFAAQYLPMLQRHYDQLTALALQTLVSSR